MEPALQQTGDVLRDVEVERIKRGRWQTRRDFNPVALQELAESIEVNGVLQPIVVRFDPDDGLYEIIAGERRWRAAQQALQYAVPVIVKKCTIAEATKYCLIENIQRDDLNPIEEAQLLDRLITSFGLTHRQAAYEIGKSRPYVSNQVKLLTLPEMVQQLLIEEKLETGHVKPLLPLPKDIQIMLANMAVRMSWSVRTIEKRANEHLVGMGEREDKLPQGRDPNLVSLENGLQCQYAMNFHVDFDTKKGRGTLQVQFDNVDQLQGLLERWGYDVPD